MRHPPQKSALLLMTRPTSASIDLFPAADVCRQYERTAFPPCTPSVTQLTDKPLKLLRKPCGEQAQQYACTSCARATGYLQSAGFLSDPCDEVCPHGTSAYLLRAVIPEAIKPRLALCCRNRALGPKPAPSSMAHPSGSTP